MLNDLNQMFKALPLGIKIFAVAFAVLGVLLNVYIFLQCGWKVFFLGNGSLFAALSGMCG